MVVYLLSWEIKKQYFKNSQKYYQYYLIKRKQPLRKPALLRPPSCWSFPVPSSSSCNNHRAEGGKMAAAESDRDSPSTLSAEFLNFSAKDTSAVSVSPGYPANKLLAVLSQRRYDALSCFWLGMFLLAQLSYHANGKAKRAARIERSVRHTQMLCASARQRHSGRLIM